jgi:hypothetical protein
MAVAGNIEEALRGVDSGNDLRHQGMGIEDVVQDNQKRIRAGKRFHYSQQ